MGVPDVPMGASSFAVAKPRRVLHERGQERMALVEEMGSGPDQVCKRCFNSLSEAVFSNEVIRHLFQDRQVTSES